MLVVYGISMAGKAAATTKTTSRAEFLALISAIGEEFSEERKQTKQRRQHESAAVSILDICRVHDGVHQQAVRIDENVPLLAFDLLSRIVTGRINRRPPFSAPFTL